METKILSGEQAICEGAELIAAGEVVAFPTETVYGLGADIKNPAAVAKIFAAKGRPQDNPLIVHIADFSQISQVAEDCPKEAFALMRRFMPGALTVVLKKRKEVPESITAGLGTVGIRMPAHPVAEAFLRACGTPLAAPSANLSTKISPTTAEHVLNDLNGRIPLIIDGGASAVGIESTVLDLSGVRPVILRPGAVTAQMLEDFLGEVDTYTQEPIGVLPSPGMRYRHYAPESEFVLACSPARAQLAYEAKRKEGKTPVILGSRAYLKAFSGFKTIDLGNTDEEIMRNIYRALHDAQKQFDFIICERFEKRGILESVMNRLEKASGGKRV